MAINYITLDTLAEQLNTGLNAMSATLEASGDISRVIPFDVSAHTQDYEDAKTYATDVIISGLLSRLTGTVAPSQKYKSYTDTVVLTIYGFTKEVEDMEKVLNEYCLQESGQAYTNGDWIYSGAYERPTIIGRGVDEGEERFSAVLNIDFAFIFKGYTSDDVLIKINDEAIPILSYTHKLTKEGKDGAYVDDGAVVKVFNTKGTITKTIKFIHIDGTEANKIFADIDTGNFLNQEYDFFYGLSCDAAGANCTYDNEVTMVLTDGTITVVEKQFQTIDATFNILKEL